MWTPEFGALCVDGGVRFRLLAPGAREIRLVLYGRDDRERPMRSSDGSIWELYLEGVSAGQRYSYRRDEGPPRPDPASRFQPEGVHGPSEVIDPRAFCWTDHPWAGVSACDLVIYELHAGTFSDPGTFAGISTRLPELRDLGVTAIEIMPVAEFAGSRNWGYDGVGLYAPSHVYGHPDDLRQLVDRAHQLGLAVLLDVVYNHLGPEGAYLPEINPQYLMARHRTPWGPAVNLDGPGCAQVRRFIVDNAVHWLREYHLDGLRLDATHALIDDSPTHFLSELAACVRSAAPKPIVLHAEDHRNLAEIVRTQGERPWGFDGVWADDFHHIVRRLVAGDAHGYYRDFEGTTQELARVIRQGWLYTGERSLHLGRERGTDPSGTPMYRFVVCVQNHDQIGNRALGERLNHQVDAATWRAVSALLLTAPMTPLLFMGQEWGADTPFRYFTDLEPALGVLVTEGRRHEFREFPEFATADARLHVPDPQAAATYEASRLRWEERADAAHAAVLALYRELLHLRRREPALGAGTAPGGEAFAPDDHSIVLRRAAKGSLLWVAVRLRGCGELDMTGLQGASDLACGDCEVVLSTEDSRFANDPQPVQLLTRGCSRVVTFARPGAVILRPRAAG